MQIVIAGGNSYIGSHLTRELLDDGHRVTWLSHTPGKAEELGFGPDDVLDVIFEYHDETGSWADEVRCADAVVNLSGYPIITRWNSTVKHLIRESRIDTTRALVDAIRDGIDDEAGTDHAHWSAADPLKGEGEANTPPSSGPQIFVNASAVGIYGDRRDMVLTEDSPPGIDWLSQLAVDWEAEAHKAEKLGVRTAMIRTAIVLGDEGFLPKFTRPMKLYVGGSVGPGNQWFSWVHLDDIVGIFKHAIENGAVSGPVNTSPDPLPMHDFAHAVGHVLHRPTWMPAPTIMLRVLLGKSGPYTVFSQRTEPHVLQETDYEWRFPELGSALDDLLG